MSKYKVLVVDYEPRGIEQLTKPLEEAGYETAVAKDGLSAIEVFAALEPDLTIIEAMLPKKGGFEVCQDLKQTPHGMKTPIVVVSAVYRGRKYRTQALHHYGADEFLEKPIDPEHLVEVAKRLLPDGPTALKPQTSAPAAAEPADPGPTVEIVTEEPTRSAGAEQEIIERLDEILSTELPASTRTPDFKGEHAGDKVITFDPSRSRRRREERSVSEPTAVSNPGNLGGQLPTGTVGGTVGNAHAIQKVEPTAIADHELAQPQIFPSASPRPHRFGLWIGAAFVLVLAAVATVVLLLTT